MQNPKPIRDNNAIDEMALAVSFKSDVVGDSLIRELLEQAKEIKNSLPEYEITSTLGVQFDSSTGVNNTCALPPGVIFYSKSKKDQERREWMLRFNSNRITVACSEYTSWDAFSRKSLGLLYAAISKIDVSDNPVIDCTYHCVDKFWNTGKQNPASNIFDSESPIIAGHIIKMKIPWLMQQRWTEENPEIDDVNIFHSLDVGANFAEQDGQKGSYVVLNHAVSVRGADKNEIADKEKLIGEGKNGGYFTQVFQRAHNLNKQTISQLLNNKTLERIGLSPESSK